MVNEPFPQTPTNLGGAIAPTGRASGILLHPSSLPGPVGIGDIGPAALRFLDWLAEAGQSLWQVLPLGPTGYGDSPYASFSSFAGNPLLVSPEGLASWALVDPSDLDADPGAGRRTAPAFPPGRVDYGAVITWKAPLLRRAAARFLAGGPAELRRHFEDFRASEGRWLDDYATFMGIKGRYPGAWNRDWPEGLALREPAAIARCKRELADEMEIERVVQFFFFTQWDLLHREAARKGVKIIGDLPVFAAPDSADVWAHRELFLLDERGRPTVVSGVPPDYFSRTGQLWGNPLYDWERLQQQDFGFLIDRMRSAFRLFDFVRVDHFRGFESCWCVPAGEPTAEHGRWVKVPGDLLFEATGTRLGELPIIAEDLGLITPEVNALRDRFRFPGMRILQFAFDSAEAGALPAGNRFLPHNHAANSVVYTGTHDNDTTRGWYDRRSGAEQAHMNAYAPFTDPEPEWRLIRMAMASPSRFAVIPMQDVLGLGSEARMNVPGTTGDHNWCWRLTEAALNSTVAKRLRALAELYGRLPSGDRESSPGG